MDVIDLREQAVQSLSVARGPEAKEIASALDSSRIVGVVGEAEVGKSRTVSQALMLRPDAGPRLKVDLDGAADGGHVAWLLARSIVRSWMGDPGASLLAVPALEPEPVRQRRLALTRIVGADVVEEAQRPFPTGTLDLDSGLECVERLTRDVGATMLWVDHIEAPSLTPRHPLDVASLLWSLRELTQREPSISIVVTGRTPAARIANGPSAAFHRSGRWLTLTQPPAHVWRGIGVALDVDASASALIAELTGGHPHTTLLALAELARRKRGADPRQVIRDLAASDDGLAARAMQHARTLHRLGGQILLQVAWGLPPYGADQRGSTSRAEVTKVLERLRLAGLLASRGRGRWEVVNPLLDMRLRQGVSRPSRRIG